jgi:hypothetical protein
MQFFFSSLMSSLLSGITLHEPKQHALLDGEWQFLGARVEVGERGEVGREVRSRLETAHKTSFLFLSPLKLSRQTLD